MKKIANNTLNIILVAILATMLISGMILISGCKGGDVAIDEAAAPEGNSDAVEVTEADEDSNGTEQDEDSDGVEEDSAGEEEAEDGQTEEEQDLEEETEEITVEITEEIKGADNYFDEGMYAEAAKEYRDAVRAINDSDISQELKEELQEMISQNHQDAKNITETARTHHTNSMTLQYEKRFEEAKAELEAALDIYPKYQTAVDALDSLEALMGLE
ncbi:MAG: hypothetical protein ABUK08_07305 [Candidatus Humimicrobiaceae bacterium]